jgi:hypothetical protein
MSIESNGEQFNSAEEAEAAASFQAPEVNKEGEDLDNEVFHVGQQGISVMRSSGEIENDWTVHEIDKEKGTVTVSKEVDGQLLGKEYPIADLQKINLDNSHSSIGDEALPTTAVGYPELPRTNQQLEVTNRFLKLRLKTMGTFHSWETATWYCNALIAYRRFLPYTDRKHHPNGRAPLELSGCSIRHIDYLTRSQKSNR